ncbi:hypothetical protein Tco_1012654, partial [Tanacetum coccineum]
KDFHEETFQVYSNPLFEFDDNFKSSNVNPLFEENDKDAEIKSSSSFILTSPKESEFEAYLEINSIPPGINLTLPPTLEVSSSYPTSPTLTREKVCSWKTSIFFSLVRFVWKMMTRIAIRKKIICLLATYLHKTPKPLSRPQAIEEMKIEKDKVSSDVPIHTIFMPIRITFDNPIDFNDHFSKPKDFKKDLTVKLDSAKSSILPSPLLDSDSPFTAELSASITLNSLRNEDKVFKPGIIVYRAIHDKNLATLEKNLRENISSGTLLVLKERHSIFATIANRLLPFYLNLPNDVTLLSFSCANEDKIFKPGIPWLYGVHYLTSRISHRGLDFVNIRIIAHNSTEICTDISKITRKPSKTGKPWDTRIDEYKKKPKKESKAEARKVKPAGRIHDGRVRKVISRPHSHSSHTSSMVEAQILVGFALYALRKEAQVCLTWIAKWLFRCISRNTSKSLPHLLTLSLAAGPSFLFCLPFVCASVVSLFFLFLLSLWLSAAVSGLFCLRCVFLCSVGIRAAVFVFALSVAVFSIAVPFAFFFYPCFFGLLLSALPSVPLLLSSLLCAVLLSFLLVCYRLGVLPGFSFLSAVCFLSVCFLACLCAACPSWALLCPYSAAFVLLHFLPPTCLVLLLAC